MTRLPTAFKYLTLSAAVFLSLTQQANSGQPPVRYNIAGGVLTALPYQASFNTPKTMRAPGPWDDNRFNDPGDGGEYIPGGSGVSTDSIDFGALWQMQGPPGVLFNAPTYQYIGGSPNNADWMAVTAGLPCDVNPYIMPNIGAQTLTTACAYAASYYKLRTAYGGGPLTLYRASDANPIATGTAISFVNGYYPDTATMNSKCGGGVGCWVVFNDQSVNAAATSADVGMWTATLTAGGSAYVNNASATATVSTTGGTGCTSPTLKVTVSGGAVTALNSTNGVIPLTYGLCTGTAPNATAQTLTIAGGGTGATVTVAWAPLYASIYTPQYSGIINNFVGMNFPSQTQPFGAYVPIGNPNYQRVATTSYTPHSSMLVVAGAQLHGTGNNWFISDTTSTWGLNGGDLTNSSWRTVGAANKCKGNGAGVNNIISKEVNVSISIVRWNGATADCFEGNAYVSAGSWPTSSTTSTGFIMGSSTSSSFEYNGLAYILFNTVPTAADINYERVSLSSMFHIQEQGNNILEVSGGSLTSGYGSALGNSYASFTPQLSRIPGLRVYNNAVEGQQLCNTQLPALLNLGGDAQMYYAYNNVTAASDNSPGAYVEQYIGLMNDLKANCSATTCTPSVAGAVQILRGCLANFVWNWGTNIPGTVTAPNYFASTVIIGGSPTGYSAGSQIQLVPPSGVTCTSLFPNSVSNPPYVLTMHTTSGAPDKYIVPNYWHGTCQGTGLVGANPCSSNWTSTGGGGLSATWTVCFLPYSQPKVMVGTVPVQSDIVAGVVYLSVLQSLWLDIQTNYANPQQAGGCILQSTCTGTFAAGIGYGAYQLNDLVSDPTIGGFVSGTGYSALGNNPSLSGDGQHMDDLADWFAALNLTQQMNKAWPAPTP